MSKNTNTKSKTTDTNLFTSVEQIRQFELALIKAEVSLSDIQKIINGKQIFSIHVGGPRVLGTPAFSTKYLKPSFEADDKLMIIDKCDGTQIISKTKYCGGGPFQSVSHDFHDLKADEYGHATPKTVVDCYDIVKDGMISDYLNSITKDTEELCLTQDQIVEFIRKHYRYLGVRHNPLFIPFKSYDCFFVAHFHIPQIYNEDYLYVRVYEFNDERVWSAEYSRIMVVRRPNF